jgi:predicted short-subunit dehydrogenase-like oxidoreductase (DUF2520 family)
MRRGEPLGRAAAGMDAVVIAVPDAAIAAVAQQIEPADTTCVLHLSGATSLRALAPHPRTASLHPLAALTGAESASRLSGAWYAVTGDRLAEDLVQALKGRSFPLDDHRRATYHAAACVASNHLVGLLGQVERLASLVGVPAEAFWGLAAGAVDNVVTTGSPQASLTGPVARGDWATIAGHLASLPADEQVTYLFGSQACARLAGRSWPNELG